MNYQGIQQIRASAGSGKTYRLTQSCIELLARSTIHENTSYDTILYDTAVSYTWMDILAMSFTNKAALQMKEACVDMLKKIALGKENSPVMSAEKAQELFIKIVPHYDKLRFSTIDSFLLQLLQILGMQLGLSRNFEIVLEKVQEEEIIKDAYNFFIDEAENNKDYQELLNKCWEFLVCDNNIAFGKRTTLQEKLFPVVEFMLKEGYFLPEYIKGTSFIKEYEEIVSLLYTAYSSIALKKKIKNEVKELYVALEKEDGLITLHANAIKVFEGSIFTKKGDPSAYIEKSSLEECYKKNAKEPSEYAKALYKKITQSVKLYSRVSKGVDEIYKIAPMVEIAQHIIENVYEYQKKHSVVLFLTVPRLIRKAFNEVSVQETLYKIGSKIRHVLLDEFQDTSQDQWDAMYMLFNEILSYGGSLIYVGDTKQAIYGFRGGDAKLFEKIIDYFNVNVDKKTLEFNWRSAEPIVHFNNLFSLIENRQYAEGILSSMLTQKVYEEIGVGCPDILESAVIELTKAYTNGSQEVSKKTKDEKGSVYIVDICEKEKDNIDEDSTDRKGIERELYTRLMTILQEYKPNEVAILTRKNKESERIASLLTEWNIPYCTEGNVYLKDSGLVQEVLAFLRMLENPLDDIIFCSALYSKKILYSLLEEEKIHEWLLQVRSESVYNAFQKDFTKEWEEYFFPLYNNRYTCAYDYLQEIYRHFQLYERYSHEKSALESVLEIAYLASKKAIISVRQFLEYWEKYEHTFVLEESSYSAVTICTIHKSKGLEYPVVIIPYTDGMAKNISALSLVDLKDFLPEEEYAIFEGTKDIPLLMSNGKSQRIHYQNMLDSAIESINNMYVAYTRAKSELHILLYKKVKENKNKYSSANALMWILEHEELTLFSKYRKEDLHEIIDVYEYTTKEKKIKNQEIILAESIKKYPYKIRVQKSIPNVFSWMPKIKESSYEELDENKYNTATKRGEILHKVISLLRSTNKEEMKAIMQRVFLELGLSKEFYKALYKDIYERVEWFLKQKSFSLYAQKGLIERDILYKKGSEIKRFRPDKMIKILDTKYIIVEYKTGKKEREHKKQLFEYMNLLKEIKGINTSVEGVLIYFDEEEIIEVKSV